MRTSLPRAVTAAPLRTVRPSMLRGVYAQPEKELLRLATSGRVTRIAPGTYTAKPDTIAFDLDWRPTPEEAAMAFATTHYGQRVPVLYGLGAARFHHCIPRAIGSTVVAVPRQRRPVALADGTRVTFTTLDVEALDATLEDSGIGAFLVTSPEQTLLDLLDRPDLGGMPDEARSALPALLTQSSVTTLDDLTEGRSAASRERLMRLLDQQNSSNGSSRA